MGAIVAARLVKYWSELFSDICSEIHLCSDSSIVIHWIKNNSRAWKPFVSYRISEIDNLTNPSCWQHCSGKSNSVDRLTRSFPIQNLTNDDLWWYGPKWLRENKLKWPKRNDLVIDDKLKNSETTSTEILQNLCTSEFKETIVKLENCDSY
ncbi:transposable element Tcb2 transposase [Trichonephila clavipes]|nr:transposable element Tcb2 transposase [Trichonephila clavipes]